MVELQVGDTFWEQCGPFLAHVIVVGVVPGVGAELQYTGETELVGFPGRLTAPDGTILTTDAMHGFLGRAHWGAIEGVKPGVYDDET